MAINGIDVSSHQGAIDWKKVAASGVEFAMIRTGYSTTKDKRFDENYKNAVAAGLKVGVYHFSYAFNAVQAKQEAEFVLGLIKGKRLDYPVAFDFEEESAAYAKKKGIRITKELGTQIAQSFLSTVENAGYYVTLYTNMNCMNLYFNTNKLKRYDVWYAQWSKKPTYNGSFGMWQKSSTGKVNGINGNVDLNEAYKDYPATMRIKGINGYKKEGVVKISDTLRNGNSGIAVYTLQLVLQALHNRKLINTNAVPNGKYDEKTSAAVKEIQKIGGEVQNGIYSQSTAEALQAMIKRL